ncbi:hypothetical protein EVAR_60401_1 [Eumeta japonica]|uniref:Uncharacterized protein n=1 Tax=Eumeta variegata TaxID=151549 RepID=A0A4C1YSR6_EUMVA|nr:hypothetical protein EVAR_60401_1 [Eumeta japonica]
MTKTSPGPRREFAVLRDTWGGSNAAFYTRADLWGRGQRASFRPWPERLSSIAIVDGKHGAGADKTDNLISIRINKISTPHRFSAWRGRLEGVLADAGTDRHRLLKVPSEAWGE